MRTTAFFCCSKKGHEAQTMIEPQQQSIEAQELGIE